MFLVIFTLTNSSEIITWWVLYWLQVLISGFFFPFFFSSLSDTYQFVLWLVYAFSRFQFCVALVHRVWNIPTVT